MKLKKKKQGERPIIRQRAYALIIDIIQTSGIDFMPVVVDVAAGQ